jgi:cobalt-precorrin 5A hydrolase/precorrin-3B C17-methyltransferase
LPRALAILRGARPPTTPVVLARNLGRHEECCVVTSLAAVDPETVDMLTVVLIGASTSRQVTLPDGRPLAFTPRGYRLP